MIVRINLLLYGSICVVYTLAAEIPLGNVHDPPLGALNFKDFPLRKCHCGANKIWKNDTCKRAITSVEYLTSFHPIKSVKIFTSDFNDLFVSNVVCKDATPIALNNVAFRETNTLFHLDSGDSFQKYCIEHVKNAKSDIVMTAIVCIPELKLPVCCVEGYSIINSTNLECKKHKNVAINPPIYIGNGNSVLPEIKISPYLQKVPHCELTNIQKKPLYLDDSGRKGSLHYQQTNILFMEWENSEHTHPIIKFPSDFCVDVEVGSETTYSVYIWDEWAVDFCQKYSTAGSFEGRGDGNCEQMMYWILLPLLVLSSVCLAVILILHAMLPELRKSIGSKITLAHVASLLAGFFVLILLQMPMNFNCKIYGPIIQGCFLATFFWLNVMCFDLWWKLRCRSPAGDDARHAKNKFMKYSIYAWGSPMIIVIVTVVLDNVQGLKNHPSVIVPGFGKRSCWFEDRTATMAYYFGIIAVLMAVDLILFVWVFIILLRANYTYNQVLRDDVRSPRRTWIYLKIFGVMGITWLFEYLSWHEGTCTYWIVTDIINSLRGLILFVIFFGNKKSYNKIKTRFSDINERFHSHISQSMNNLRKLSLKPTSTAESTLEAIRISEASSETSNRINGHHNEVIRREIVNGST